MRDYSQYALTPTKKKNRVVSTTASNHNNNHHHSANSKSTLSVTPSPASSSVATYPGYLHPTTVTKSQVAVLSRSSAQLPQVHQGNHHQHSNQQLQKRDAGSISTTATQSSNDHSPRSNTSTDDVQQQQQHHHENNPQQHRLQQSSPQSHSHVSFPNRHHPGKSPTHQQHHSSSSSSPYPSQHSSQSPQHHHQQTVSPSTIPARDLTSLTPADALSLKRDGPEATIVQLRQALEEARLRDAAEKSHLAKSDATILELRSSVRQLKRQLEKLDTDARQKHTDLVAAKQQLQMLRQQVKQQQQHHHSDDASSSQQLSAQEHALAKEERVGELQVQLDRAHAQILTADMVRKELEDTLEAEQYTWELRVQDQERTIQELQQEVGVLHDDLEQCRQQWKQAEDEWNQKVSHLEHTLSQYQNNTNAASADPKRTQQDAEMIHKLRDKLRQLEEERNELQTCLDEALLELEAVDAELGNNNTNNQAELQQLRQENQRLQETVQKQRALQQQQQLQQGDADFDTLEGLQHLYRWLLERSSTQEDSRGEEKKNDTMPQTSPELLDAIHHVLESMPSVMNSTSSTGSADHQKIRELESQIVQYRGDLQVRDESSAELRSNLQEAVALIKPLQDAVDKADQQKADLQQEIERLRADHETETKEMQEELRTLQRNLQQKEQECDKLHHDMHKLQIEVEGVREVAQARQTLQGLSPTAAAAAAVAAMTKPPTEAPQELSSLSKARADLKAKRAQEQTLRSLLRDAQNRFHTLNQQNQSVEALNQQLQGRLRDVEEHGGDDNPHNHEVHELEQQLSKLSSALAEKSAEVEQLHEQAKRPSPEVVKHVEELQSKLNKTQEELRHKLQSEKVLNKSLKEALSLLKPLKSHLEEAEAENKDLNKEVRSLRRKITSMEISGMGTVVASPNNAANKTANGDITPVVRNQSDEKMLREKEQLEETVRHLEQENSQLHDALDEMSRMQSGNNANINGNNHNNPTTTISNKAEVRLNQEIVELKSRYEVTRSRLEDAYVENHTLVEALKEKEESEKDAMEGMRILREKLRKTEMDLQNAKYIATSALVKVEQAKSHENSHHHHNNMSGFESESHTVLSLEEKAIELDLLAAVGVKQTPSPGSTAQSPVNGLKPRQYHAAQQQHQQQEPHQPSYMSPSFGAAGSGQPMIAMHKTTGNGINSMNTNNTIQANGWAGKRSRLADF